MQTQYNSAATLKKLLWTSPRVTKLQAGSAEANFSPVNIQGTERS